jgi:hypothetical protein
MERGEKRVDGFRFLPPGLRAWIRSFIPRGDFTGRIPWTPLAKPLRQATMGLVTSAGISLKIDPPFDMEREKTRHTTGDDIDVNHLHINTTYIQQDINVVLPLARMASSNRKRSSAGWPRPPTPSTGSSGRAWRFWRPPSPRSPGS